MRSWQFHRKAQRQTPVCQSSDVSGKPLTKAVGVNQQLFATNELLVQVVQHLQAQTEELKQIKRSAAACDHKLSFMAACMQQLVGIGALVAQHSCTIATAAAEFMRGIAAAQHAAKLQLTVSSGRLIMLVLLIIMSFYTGVSAVRSSCRPRSQLSIWPRLRLPTALTVPLAWFIQQWAQQKQQKGLSSLFNSWLPNPRVGWCIATAAGRFMLGEMALLLWAVYAYSQRSKAAAIAAGSKDMAPTACLQGGIPLLDPLLSMVLAVLPVGPDNSSTAAAVLQAAVYEGLYGAVAVALVSGRWLAWLLCWELWLACCYCSCTVSLAQQNRFGQQRERAEQLRPAPDWLKSDEASKPPNVASAACYPTVQGLTAQSAAAQQQQQQQQHKPSRANCSAPRFGLYLQLLLAAAQLLLPVIMAGAAVWH